MLNLEAKNRTWSKLVRLLSESASVKLKELWAWQHVLKIIESRQGVSWSIYVITNWFKEKSIFEYRSKCSKILENSWMITTYSNRAFQRD